LGKAEYQGFGEYLTPLKLNEELCLSEGRVLELRLIGRRR